MGQDPHRGDRHQWVLELGSCPHGTEPMIPGSRCLWPLSQSEEGVGQSWEESKQKHCSEAANVSGIQGAMPAPRARTLQGRAGLQQRQEPALCPCQGSPLSPNGS